MPPQTVVVDSGASGKFTVDSRYAFIKKLGGGAYGLVAQFNDSVTGEVVAIKKTTKAFDDPVDAKRTLRELKLLNHLNHENIVRLVDVLPGGATGSRDQQDVYAAMESMDTDLHQIIRSKQALTDEHAQYFMYQLLCALQFMHSADVLHRDLKPGCAPPPRLRPRHPLAPLRSLASLVRATGAFLPHNPLPSALAHRVLTRPCPLPPQQPAGEQKL